MAVLQPLQGLKVKYNIKKKNRYFLKVKMNEMV